MTNDNFHSASTRYQQSSSANQYVYYMENHPECDGRYLAARTQGKGLGTMKTITTTTTTTTTASTTTMISVLTPDNNNLVNKQRSSSASSSIQSDDIHNNECRYSNSSHPLIVKKCSSSITKSPHGVGDHSFDNRPNGCPKVSEVSVVPKKRFYDHDYDNDDDDATDFPTSLPTIQPPPILLQKGNIVKHHLRQDPTEYYTFLKVLGQGSMGSVLYVKKRSEVIGGSARTSFVKKKQQERKKHDDILEMILESSCFLFCPFGKNTDNRHRPRDLFEQVLPEEDEHSIHSGRANDSHIHRSGENHQSDYFAGNDTDGHSKLNGNRKKDILCAMKTTRLDRNDSSEIFIKGLENEVKILQELDHPHIIRMIETFQYRKYHYIIMECCPGGNLYSRDPYTERDGRQIVTSLLSAVSYMHSKNIVHRDIKFENILFTSRNTNNMEVKLVDFGLSRKYTIGSYLHTRVGTAYTMAPELLKGTYTCSVDVWSVGIIAYMLLSGSMPFYGKDRNHVFQKISKGSFSFYSRRWKRVSNKGRKFVSYLLEKDPNQRPTAEQCLRIPWLWNNEKNSKKDKTNHNDETNHEKFKNSNFNFDRMVVMDHIIASMQKFVEYRLLKKLALMIVAFRCTDEEQISILRQTFVEEFVVADRSLRRANQNRMGNADGEITLPAFKAAILDDHLYTEEELEGIFYGIAGMNSDGVIRYNDFLAATIETQGAVDEHLLAEAFDRLDWDDSGYICTNDLKQFLLVEECNNNNKTSNNNDVDIFIEQIIAEIDVLDHDGLISYEEFLTMWNDDDGYRNHNHTSQLQFNSSEW